MPYEPYQCFGTHDLLRKVFGIDPNDLMEDLKSLGPSIARL